ncbi:uncharacterized protein OCT59_015209 [Rhizophagus irregularis]|uniref:uncharacterized protein n=1 Tax=Rhizophagus irregularis TaxID=588596 RepID=UPI0033251363|nr:hypothetical protein OCT59_015209 [Rhizophagus irregularis]
MEEFKLSDDVIEQIKDFNYNELTDEQRFLIDKLILNEELKERYKDNGLCKDCKQPKITSNWCQFALKCLHNSQNITSEFLREIESHNTIVSDYVTRCFGITKDPESNNFMMVIEYAKEGSLRQYLNNIFNSMKWEDKLDNLVKIAAGLKSIHEKGLIHHDFHCGNMLKGGNYTIITDLGLCQPANVKSSQNNECEKKVYGVLPYVAPEVLRGGEYTQESDIYAFGIIAYEVCTGLPPYHDIAHDKFLAISICQGVRPKSNYKIPQLILDIIKQCWDADPSKRPKAQELYKLVDNLYDHGFAKYKGEIIKKQAEEADKINEKFTSTSLPYNGTTLSYTTNPQAVYTSRLLNFKNLPEPKNAIDNKVDVGEYSESIEAIDFTKLNLDENN